MKNLVFLVVLLAFVFAGSAEAHERYYRHEREYRGYGHGGAQGVTERNVRLGTDLLENLRHSLRENHREREYRERRRPGVTMVQINLGSFGGRRIGVPDEENSMLVRNCTSGWVVLVGEGQPKEGTRLAPGQTQQFPPSVVAYGIFGGAFKRARMVRTQNGVAIAAPKGE
jgi:hypothetical protein